MSLYPKTITTKESRFMSLPHTVIVQVWLPALLGLLISPAHDDQLKATFSAHLTN